MAGLTHVVDTSVLTRLGDPAVRDALLPRVRSRTLARALITDLEVGFSARNGAEWDRLNDALDIAVGLPVDAVDFERALTVQRLLAERNQRGRKLPDLLISAVAERRRLTVLHYDSDFDLIAQATGQPCEWVVPAGAVS